MAKNPKILPHDHVTRWLHESDSRPGEHHLVDLKELNGNGECSCEHFMYRLKPELERGERQVARCTHIRAVREHLLDFVLETL